MYICRWWQWIEWIQTTHAWKWNSAEYLEPLRDTCKKFLVWKEGNLQEFLQPSLAVEKFLEGHGQYWIERLQGGNPRYMMPHLSHSPLNVYMAVALWASNLWSWHLPSPFFFYTLISLSPAQPRRKIYVIMEVSIFVILWKFMNFWDSLCFSCEVE